MAEVPRFDAAQGAFDLDQVMLAPAGRFPGHLLALNGVDARDPADAGLIKLNGLRRLLGAFLELLDFPLQFKQALAVCLDFVVFHAS